MPTTYQVATAVKVIHITITLNIVNYVYIAH